MDDARGFHALTYRGQVRRMRALAAAALPDFGIDPSRARLTRLAHFDNTTFRVDTLTPSPGPDEATRFVLRIHRAHGSPWHPPRSIRQVRSELDWLAALRRDTTLTVPIPQPTRAGDLLTTARTADVPDERICVLFAWLPGRFLNAGLTARHLERVGAFIGRLHEHVNGWTPPADFERPPVGVITDAATEWMLPLTYDVCGADAGRVVAAVIERVRAAQDELATVPGSSALIHGDLHQENYLFHRGGIRAIDFDDCGVGPLLYDLSVPLNELWGRADLPQLRSALLRGYASVRPLPDNAEYYLHMFDVLRILQLTIWHIEERNRPGFENWQREVHDNLPWLAKAIQ
jgi:Ser/Thr protein kinase RdoA (MazF antagonist)